MIKENTVFILGAGASNPYGLPTGDELRKYLCNEFSHDYEMNILAQIQEGHLSKDFEHREAIDMARIFARNFTNSHTPSIDLYLSRKRDEPETVFMGKMAIIFSILKSEQSSQFEPNIQDDKKKEQDWYFELYARMTNTLIEPDSYKLFGDNNVSFITFNYDRTLEHFFYISIHHSFFPRNLTATHKREIWSVLNEIPIIHVYGQVAPLPWQNDASNIPYRTPVKYRHLEHFRENIQTIYEADADGIKTKVSKKISEAKKIFFLGFRYADENLKTLGIPKVFTQRQKIYGTAFGDSTEQKEKHKAKLKKRFKRKDGPVIENEVILENCDCRKLIMDYL